MRERPILFSGPMVRAILAGTKTQTRRTLRAQPDDKLCHGVHYDRTTGGAMWGACPYGVPGDRLWVREAWRVSCHIDDQPPRECFKYCSPSRALQMQYVADGHEPMSCCSEWGKVRPSIFMPRRASRITLEITDVRVQRLQEISEEDAKAEGVEPYRLPVHSARESMRHADGFSVLWDSINAKRAPWASNPWVWDITFARVTK